MIKNVFIEGDKSGFYSKTSITKFKDIIKNNNNFDISELKRLYIKNEYNLELISKEIDFIKFNLSLSSQINNTELKNNLKQKIKEIKSNRSKIPNNDTSENLNKLYADVKKINSNIPIPEPDTVLQNPVQFKPIITLLEKSLRNKMGNSNPCIKYLNALLNKLNTSTDNSTNLSNDTNLNLSNDSNLNLSNNTNLNSNDLNEQTQKLNEPRIDVNEEITDINNIDNDIDETDYIDVSNINLETINYNIYNDDDTEED